MPILISHNSALERLRAVPPQVDGSRMVDQPVNLADFVPEKGELARIDIASLGLVQRPLHHLVPMRVRRSDASGVKSHRTILSTIPAGLLVEVGPGVYACAPELTFIQMVRDTSLLGAVVLGHELCGTYSHFARFVSGFYERPPLTSTERIRRAIDQLEGQGMHGLSAARRALRWVRDGSASPMETMVSCMLHLPTRMGGFGLMAPQLNYEQELDDAAQRTAGRKTCRVDTAYLYQRDGVDHKDGMEFDGKDYHRDQEADRVRREALAHMGWTIYVVDIDDMTSYEKVEKKVALLDGVPRQAGEGKPDKKRGAQLLKRLQRATRFGVGMNAALFGVIVPRGKVKVHL